MQNIFLLVCPKRSKKNKICDNYLKNMTFYTFFKKILPKPRYFCYTEIAMVNDKYMVNYGFYFTRT